MVLSAAAKAGGSAAFIVIALTLGGCVAKPTAPFFMAPTESPRTARPGMVPATVGPLSATTAGASEIVNPPTPSPTPPCTNDLTYIQDLTVPDGSNFAPGQEIDKRWQVRNSGTCNWDRRYGLKLISGDAMGNQSVLPLYPARAGAGAILEIHFTAPSSGGLYECDWRAVDPEGQPFGDPVYMQISVAP